MGDSPRETSADYLRRLILKSEGTTGGEGPTAPPITALDWETVFRIEKDLQAALRKNIEQLEEGLEIIDGGKERTTASGRIDITAKDKDEKLVVIELKAGNADVDVIGQI